MGELMVLLVVCLYAGATLLATILFLRQIHRHWGRLRGLLYEAVEDPYEPAPIEKTGAVTLVGVVALIWALAHLGGVAAWVWISLGPAPVVAMILLATYVGFVATINAVGSILLLRRVAFGRKMLSWGHFLFGLGGVLGSLMMLLAWQHDKTPDEVRRVAPWAAVALGVYAVLTVVVGYAATRVGAPPEQKPVHEEPLEPVGDLYGFEESDGLGH